MNSEYIDKLIADHEKRSRTRYALEVSRRKRAFGYTLAATMVFFALLWSIGKDAPELFADILTYSAIAVAGFFAGRGYQKQQESPG